MPIIYQECPLTDAERAKRAMLAAMGKPWDQDASCLGISCMRRAPMGSITYLANACAAVCGTELLMGLFTPKWRTFRRL